jgi:hypothetical protein
MLKYRSVLMGPSELKQVIRRTAPCALSRFTREEPLENRVLNQRFPKGRGLLSRGPY